MKILAFLIAGFAGFMSLALAQPSHAADTDYGQQKVVYHINYTGGDDNKAYKGAMRNIQNHINAVGADNMQIKVVLHGNGVDLVKAAKADAQMAATVDNLKIQNVGFLICANTLKGRNIDFENDLYDVNTADIVPSGVAELSHLQQQGYTYIKP